MEKYCHWSTGWAKSREYCHSWTDSREYCHWWTVKAIDYCQCRGLRVEITVTGGLMSRVRSHWWTESGGRVEILLVG